MNIFEAAYKGMQLGVKDLNDTLWVGEDDNGHMVFKRQAFKPTDTIGRNRYEDILFSKAGDRFEVRGVSVYKTTGTHDCVGIIR